jgi:hypothetical protein
MVAWKVCPSLETLHGQLNLSFPTRDRTSDGSIGDAAHASRTSDHNPHLRLRGTNWVSARDWTHDPERLDCDLLAQSLVSSRDSRIKYVIWNRRIVSGNGGPAPWSWRPYSGTSPHNRHLHLSVVSDERALDPAAWVLPALLPQQDGPLRLGSTGPRVTQLQQILNRWYPSLPPLTCDGAYGPKTVERVRYFQLRADLEPDGIVGPATRTALGIR